MELRRLGPTGLKVSVLSMGAMTFGESGTFMKGVTSTDDEARRVFDKAIDVGMNLVDTANIYGDGASEVLTGQWVKGKRDRVLVATKCRFPFGMGTDKKPGPFELGLSRKHILEACEASLKRLDTDVIDLYQVHMQDRSVPIDETLRALDDLVRQGKVRYVGCSNYAGYRLAESLWSAETNRTVRFCSVQLQWSLITRGGEREVLPACSAFGLGTMIWSPLARGFLSGKYKKDAPPPPGSRLEAWKDSLRSLDRPAELGDPGDGRAHRGGARDHGVRGRARVDSAEAGDDDDHRGRAQRGAARRQREGARDHAERGADEGPRRGVEARVGLPLRLHRHARAVVSCPRRGSSQATLTPTSRGTWLFARRD
jgi:aryl-alcohol dehydrogenase-like predicted oxidoreductase